MDLSIIIVNWKVKDYLEKCLVSIFQETKEISFEVLVVDNASDDGSLEIVRQKFPQVKLITSPQNLGFAKANNLAIRESRGELILLLNPDTQILDKATVKMLSFMRDHPEIGVLGCQLLNADRTLQPSIRNFPDLASQVCISLKLHHFIPALKFLAKYFARDFDYSKTQEASQIMGAFFMIKRKVIEEIGLLDEKFFLWFEEVDFCLRAKKAGWQVVYTPKAQIIHYGARSFNQILSLKKQFIFNKSLLYYLKKHKMWGAYLVGLTLQPVSLFLALLTQLFFRLRSPQGEIKN